MRNYNLKIKKNQTVKKYIILHNDFFDSKNYCYRLTQPNASLELCIMLLGRKKHSMKIQINVIHEAPRTKSFIRFRSALFDNFHLEAIGRVIIEKNAPGSETFLEMRSLLFGDKSKARIDPILDIQNNNVKASHAAAIGRISEEDIFYLRSRGFSKKQAEKIFLKEYFMPVESPTFVKPACR